jgi:4-hydroxybenzoate polyprenyltransferase
MRPNEHRLLAAFKLLRPDQWTKNLFVFMPIFFGGQLQNISMLNTCLIVFAAFSLAASSIYCFNDICDAKTDKLHPTKCKRPIASGAIHKNAAYATMIFCLLLSMSILYFFGKNINYTAFIFILLYYVMNIAYCLKLKQYAIIDVMIVATGFVLRVWTGGAAINIHPTEWIIIMTFLLALFLAFAKRRDDVVLCQNTGVSHRKNTNQYNLDFMNQVITIIAAVTIVAYFMYTLSPDVMERLNSRHLYLTAIFVLMGIIRYLQITIVDLKSGNPVKILLRDRFIQGCIMGWVGVFWVIIYL